MSQPFLKTIAFMLCAVLVGASGELSASALESQYDYCKDFADDQKAVCESVLSELEQIDRNNLLEANKIAVAAVEQQIPKFNALKEVPYAKSLAEFGGACGLQQMPSTNPWNSFCGPLSAKMVLAAELAGVADTDFDVTFENPTFQTMIAKTFKELIDLGKADARYTSDDEFRTAVDIAEQNYNNGMTLLREAVLYFDESANVDSMSSAELLAIIKTLPEYNEYNLEAPEDNTSSMRYITGLYATYASAKYTALYTQELPEDIEYEDFGIYNSVIDIYTKLVTAATAVDADFKVDLSSLQKPQVMFLRLPIPVLLSLNYRLQLSAWHWAGLLYLLVHSAPSGSFSFTGSVRSNAVNNPILDHLILKSPQLRGDFVL